MSLHKKIQERKTQAPAILYSSVSLSERAARKTGESFEELLAKRIVSGYLFVWGNRNMHGEKMVKGCCAKSIAERGPASGANYKLTYLNQHFQHEALAQFEEMEEDDFGLWFRTKPFDDVPWADHVLTQIKSGTLNQNSGGFYPVWSKAEYDVEDDSIVYTEIQLWEGSIVTIGSDGETYVNRSAESETDLVDDTEFFLRQLPRKQQLEARQLFARHKALLKTPEPDEQKKRTLRTQKPPANGINYDYLIKNL